MITLRLDKNGGINKGDVVFYESDNISEKYVIQLYKNNKIYDLTGKTIELTIVEKKRKYGNIFNLPIENATEGKFRLLVTSDISKECGLYDFKVTVKDDIGLVETFPSFQVEVLHDLTRSIASEIVNSDDFEILTEGLKALSDYNIYKTNAMKVPSIEENIKVINSSFETIEKKVDDHIESCSGGETSIDDTTISTDRTWSSAKIEDFVLTNDDVVWSTVQGENLSIDYTKEGFLREVEIFGNTIQNEEDLSDIQHLGELYVDEEGQPILDGEGREQYKIEIISSNLYNSSISINEFSKITPINKSGFTAFNINNIEYIIAKLNDKSLIATHSNGIKIYNTNLGLGIETKITPLEGFEDYLAIYNWNNIAMGNGKDILLQALNLGHLELSIKIKNKPLIHNNLSSLVKSYKTTLLLPCQLMKAGDVADRLYWDSEKEKYVVEKKVDIPEGYDQLIDETLVLETSQLIETNITKEILVPCYKDKTHLFVTGGIDGAIKAKVPLDGGQAIQSLSVMNLALNEEVSTLTLENEELKSTNDTQDELINTTMLATDEMYMMIEPLLLEAVQTLSLERSVSKMVDMYVAMVQRGLKTIDEVPARYREQVKEILAQLEK